MEGGMSVNTERVLILTLSFGSGHTQAARTIARELKTQTPDAEVRVIDALEDCRRLFRAGYVWPYWAMLRYAPALWDRFFARRIARKIQHTAPEWSFLWGCPRIFEAIAEFKPQTIVAVEVAACEMAAIAKRGGLTNARIVNVITDYEAEPAWVKPETDVYAVVDERVRSQLSYWGVSEEKIETCGIPTDVRFRSGNDERTTRARYGIYDDIPIVLIMGGGMGPTRMHRVVAHLIENREQMHVIVVTGHDRRARRRIARFCAEPTVSLRLLGWTEDIAALMKAASVLVTKPGGLTIAEAALCGLPLVLFDAIPGPEQRNSARVADAGAGIVTTSPLETSLAALSLLRDESARRRMSACAQRLARPDAAAEIVRLITNREVSAQPRVRRMTA
jgi:processive 1,2-diacylglycerol beta-glucosyltransferase